MREKLVRICLRVSIDVYLPVVLVYFSKSVFMEHCSSHPQLSLLDIQ